MNLYSQQRPDDQRTVNIYVKYGNIRAKGNTLHINLQKQLQAMGRTYKPFGTHLTIAKWKQGIKERDSVLFAKRVAESLGNRAFIMVFEAWGPHSVRVKGPIYECIHRAIAIGKPPADAWVPDPLHVELRPRLPPYCQYLEVDQWEVEHYKPRQEAAKKGKHQAHPN